MWVAVCHPLCKFDCTEVASSRSPLPIGLSMCETPLETALETWLTVYTSLPQVTSPLGSAADASVAIREKTERQRASINMTTMDGVSGAAVLCITGKRPYYMSTSQYTCTRTPNLSGEIRPNRMVRLKRVCTSDASAIYLEPRVCSNNTKKYLPFTTLQLCLSARRSTRARKN